MEKQTTLVTGASGFIGHKVCSLLLERGDIVVGIDNMNDYYDVTLKDHRLSKLINNKNFIFIKKDIEDLSQMREIFKKYQFKSVFNIAARAGVRYSMENPWIYMRTNAEGTLNLLECMKEFGVKKMILSSTSSLYAGLPMPFTEDLPVNTPISQYAASKKAAEAFAYTYHKQYNLDISIVRYFTVFGPLGRPDMAPYRFCKWILEGKPITLFGDGSFARDFTYIDDIAYGTLLAEKPMGYEIINLGGGKEPITIKSFIDTISQICNKEAIIEYHPTHSADMDYTMADITKAKRVLGWEPKTGVREALEIMLSNPNEFRFNI